MRYGELTAFEERPHSPYYGSADATPLFVVLLDEYERWSGELKLVRELEFEARAALRWIDEPDARPCSCSSDALASVAVAQTPAQPEKPNRGELVARA